MRPPHPGRPEWPAGSGRWPQEQSVAFLPSPRQRREKEEARLSRHDLLSHGIQGYSWPFGLGSGAGTGSRASASSSLTSSSLYPPTRSPSRPRPRSLPGVGAELAGANPKVAAVLGWGHRPLALLRGANPWESRPPNSSPAPDPRNRLDNKPTTMGRLSFTLLLLCQHFGEFVACQALEGVKLYTCYSPCVSVVSGVLLLPRPFSFFLFLKKFDIWERFP